MFQRPTPAIQLYLTPTIKKTKKRKLENPNTLAYRFDEGKKTKEQNLFARLKIRSTRKRNHYYFIIPTQL
jgi:hypothetical protein